MACLQKIYGIPKSVNLKNGLSHYKFRTLATFNETKAFNSLFSCMLRIGLCSIFLRRQNRTLSGKSNFGCRGEIWPKISGEECHHPRSNVNQMPVK